MSEQKISSRPIPAICSTVTALDYHSIPIEISDSRAAEPLVKASDFDLACQSFYGRTDGLNAPYFQAIRSSLQSVWVRQTVAELLVEVNQHLRKRGLELFLLDGYRPLDCQQALWDFFIEVARNQLVDPSEENCRQFVGQYWSDPTKFDSQDFTTWPTHMTGGAVDLTIRRISSGEHLYMGGIFDDSSEVSHTRFYEAKNLSDSMSFDEARRNRRLLYWSMTDAGFASYSYEWWHFDFGTQMWVMNRGLMPDGREPKKEPLKAFYGLPDESSELVADRTM